MTKLPEMRDRSVVKSSVMASAKYSWSGSRDRFSNGSTTNDRRGIAALAGPTELCGPAVGAAATGTFACGQAHQTALATPIAATSAAAMTAGRGLTNRRVRAGSDRDTPCNVAGAAAGLIS